MGIFIISPYDKGGKLYKPSAKLARLHEPDGLSPIEFNSLWLLRHSPPAHTLVVGAARPGDFDQVTFIKSRGEEWQYEKRGKWRSVT